MGTPAYMSPEQARGEVTALKGATDIWSLGCVLHEMLAGRSPFAGETPAAVIARVLLEAPPPLSAARGDVPGGIARVVRSCLEKRVRDRYSDAAGLRDDLERVLCGRAPRARHGRLVARRAFVVAAAAAIVTLAALVLEPGPQETTIVAPEPSRPSMAEGLAAQARALRQSDPRRAAELLAGALDRDPARHAWRIERGLLLWALGESAAAREAWERVPADSPEGITARFYRALEAGFRLEGGNLRFDEARPHLEAVAATRGSAARLALGALAIHRGDFSAARDSLAGATGWEAAIVRGSLERLDPAGDLGEGLRQLDLAIAEGIPFAWVFNDRGLVRSRLGDHRGAVEDLTTAIRLWPGFAAFYGNRSSFLKEAHEFDRAVEDAQKAVDIEPGDAGFRRNLGTIREAAGDFAGAIEALGEAIRLAPDPATLTNRGALHARCGDLAKAHADFERALQLDPRHSGALLNRGNARQLQGDLGGAEADFLAAIGAEPDMAEARLGLAMVRQGRGDLAGAVAALREFLALSPDDDRTPEIRAWLARCEARLGGSPDAGARGG